MHGMPAFKLSIMIGMDDPMLSDEQKKKMKRRAARATRVDRRKIAEKRLKKEKEDGSDIWHSCSGRNRHTGGHE